MLYHISVMFSVEILVLSGKGGDGSASFWHEKFQPFGGPDGGDGGKGADVYIKADSNISDLSAYRSRTMFKAEGGGNGRKQKMHGRDGVDLVINVPVGTVVYKGEDGARTFLADLDKNGMEVMVVRGGKGGLGNVHFATATNKAPKKATQGRSGESIHLILEHKLMIDVCLLGLPNSGKSTLLSQITNARPKIAEYPFTTIKPVLGRVDTGYDSFTVVEIPALSGGSKSGSNRAEEFLGQAGRAKVILFLLDGASARPAKDLQLIREEVQRYAPDLLLKRQLIAVNKIDLPEVLQKETDMLGELEGYGLPVCFISATTGQGTSGLVQRLDDLLKTAGREKMDEADKEFVFRPRPISRNKS